MSINNVYGGAVPVVAAGEGGCCSSCCSCCFLWLAILGACVFVSIVVSIMTAVL